MLLRAAVLHFLLCTHFFFQCFLCLHLSLNIFCECFHLSCNMIWQIHISSFISSDHQAHLFTLCAFAGHGAKSSSILKHFCSSFFLRMTTYPFSSSHFLTCLLVDERCVDAVLCVEVPWKKSPRRKTNRIIWFSDRLMFSYRLETSAPGLARQYCYTVNFLVSV